MGKYVFGTGMALGYVLGSRAGRQRYEQIAAAASRLRDRPGVRLVAGVASARASQLVRGARGRAAS